MACEAPSPPTRGVIEDHSGDYLIGDSLYVRCIAGYSLIGSSELKCLENGSWSSKMPSCTSKF